MSEDIPIGTVLLTEASKLVFSVSQWRGRYFANVRKFVTTQKYEGPTRAGLSLNIGLLDLLVTTLVQLEKAIPPPQENEFKAIIKRATEFIRIRTLPDMEAGDLPHVDIREYVDRPAYQGPTKRGIRFRWNLLPEVIACLRKQVKVIVENEENEPSLFSAGIFKQKQEQEEGDEQSGPDDLSKLLGEVLKQFPDDFLNLSLCKYKQITLPEASLRLEQDNIGAYLLRTNDGNFAKVRNPTEANFIIYAQLRGHREISLPEEMICVFKIVKAYEKYLLRLRVKLLAKLLMEARQQSVAEYETDKLLRQHGLPSLKA